MKWYDKILKPGAAKAAAIYTGVIVTTTVVIWTVSAAFYDLKTVYTNQQKINVEVLKGIDTLTQNVKCLTVKVNKQLADTVRINNLANNLGILAKSYEGHIMRDEQQTDILIQEIRNISPLLMNFNEKKNGTRFLLTEK